MENTSKESIFLGKLELMLQKFDDLDNIYNELQVMIKENPSNQQKIDWELSDYYHKLEDSTNTDIEFINIGKKIQQARLIRSDYSRVFEIIKCYNENKNKLIWSAQHDRDEFRKAIKYAIKYLHEDYKYRVLSEDDIKNLKKGDKSNPKTITVKVDEKITPEKVEECLAKGMKNNDIAKLFGITASYLSHYKARHGINTRKYKKRG